MSDTRLVVEKCRKFCNESHLGLENLKGFAHKQGRLVMVAIRLENEGYDPDIAGGG